MKRAADPLGARVRFAPGPFVAEAQTGLRRSRAEAGRLSTARATRPRRSRRGDAVGADAAAQHRRCVERQGRRAAPAECDAPPPAECRDARQGLPARLAQASLGESHGRVHLVGEDAAHEGLALAGGGDRAGRVVRPGAGSRDRAVAHAPRLLAHHAPGRGRRRQVSGRVAGHGAHGAVDVVVEPAARVLRAQALELGRALGGHETRGIHPRELRRPVVRERLGARADQEHVVGVLQDASRQRHRMRHARDAGHRADGAGTAVHDGRVHLHAAVGREHRAPARVEAGVRFEGHDGAHHGLERRAAVREHGVARAQRGREAGPQGRLRVAVEPRPGEPAGPAVDCEDGAQGRPACRAPRAAGASRWARRPAGAPRRLRPGSRPRRSAPVRRLRRRAPRRGPAPGSTAGSP